MKFAVALLHTFLLGFPNNTPTMCIKLFSDAVAGDLKILREGSFRTSNIFILLLSCLVYFYYCLVCLISKIQKKLVTCINIFISVCIFYFQFCILCCTCYFGLLLCLVLYLLSMDSLFDTTYYWHGGFTKEHQNYYKEYRLSQKGKYLWEQISRLNYFAKNLCSTYDESYCFNESFCWRRHKHLPF